MKKPLGTGAYGAAASEGVAVFRHVFERGLASLIARWMLEGRSDAIFRSIEKSGALSDDEVAKLRAETVAYLGRVREDGAQYSEMVLSAFDGVRSLLPDVGTLARGAGHAALMAALRAVEQANANRGADVAWATAASSPGPGGASSSPAAEPPPGPATADSTSSTSSSDDAESR